MRYQEALDHLDSLIDYEVMPRAGAIEGLSLAPMQRLMAAMGDPQLSYPVLHVTGTNGKGSVVAMAEALLGAMGLRVGAYTSPHLQRVNERIRIAGSAIDDETFAAEIAGVARVAAASGCVAPTWFETLSAAALSVFAGEGVDVAVVEVGMLGRYDATNVVHGEVAVITNVGLDHSLGGPGWEREVASEKAGIIEGGATLVLGEDNPGLADIFAAQDPARTLRAGSDFSLGANRLAVGGRLVDMATPRACHDEVFVALHGAHQGRNALTAVVAVEEFFDAALPADVIVEAFAAVELPGRLEVVARSPLVILDTAHNVPAAEALVAALDDFGAGRRVLVVGMQDGRDPTAVFAALDAPKHHLIVTTRAPTPRGLPAEELARAAAAAGGTAEPVHDVEAALDHALSVAESDDVVVVAGSNTVVGAISRIADEL